MDDRRPRPLARRFHPAISTSLLLLLALLALVLAPQSSTLFGLSSITWSSSLPWAKGRLLYNESQAKHASFKLLNMTTPACPKQPDPLVPKIGFNRTAAKPAIKLLEQAVQIPTVSYDDNGEPGDDPRWGPFFGFQRFLQRSFPLAWSNATIEYVNTLGIVATFQGADPSLKPLLLMSHYDVTPAPEATYDRWTHPPFSGFNDGEFIWGRGSADDKNLLIAQWSAITLLLESGFKFRRTVILSHGFDEEEVFARRGQGRIAPFLEKKYGFDSLLMVIDEGGGTSTDYYGAAFALPAMGEKGYLDMVITVNTKGGHSSIPPEHTGIGIMSEIIIELEANPFETKLTPASPFLTALSCASTYAPSFPALYTTLLKSNRLTELANILAKSSNRQRAELGTTIAIDIINGGVKINALPEVVTMMVNFRIDFSESLASTKKHLEDVVKVVADKFPAANITVEMLGLPIEPAPKTPADGKVFELFAGTVKGTLGDFIVTPYASTGNTDCKMYYNLTRNVYRFSGGPSGASYNAHTVDERSGIEAFLDIIHWVHGIVQNADAFDDE